MGYTTTNMLTATGSLYQILALINDLRINTTSLNKGKVNVQDLINYMLNHLENNVTLNDFVEFTQISKYHLIRVFKEKTGYSPIDYYVRLKIQKSCALLSTQDLSINEISVILKFSDSYFFSKVFKKVMGVAPSVYRKIQPPVY